MLIGDIHIVDKHVRIFDMDGSYVEIGADDAIDLLGWLLQQKSQLLEIIRQETKRLQSREDNVR